MTYKISFPQCYVCGIKEEVYRCQVCLQYACQSCTERSPDNEYCQHIKKVESEVSSWTLRPHQSSSK